MFHLLLQLSGLALDDVAEQATAFGCRFKSQPLTIILRIPELDAGFIGGQPVVVCQCVSVAHIDGFFAQIFRLDIDVLTGL